MTEKKRRRDGHPEGLKSLTRLAGFANQCRVKSVWGHTPSVIDIGCGLVYTMNLNKGGFLKTAF
jgi:hypothetical protein